MATITAQMVNDLRAKTGQGMMECKKMLTEFGGDIEKAIEGFRKKGVKSSLTERATTEGRVEVGTSPDFKTVVAAELNCNTDFTARSNPVIELGKLATGLLLNNPSVKVAENPDVKAKLVEVSQQTGENVQVGRTRSITASGKAGAYQHYTGKVGVLVALAGNPSDELIRDLCLHITATRPLSLNRDSLPADLVAKEREIAIDQARQTGKPQNIAEKIAEGKMRTFYEERVLLDQKFVKDDSKTITDVLAPTKLDVVGFKRYKVGELS